MTGFGAVLDACVLVPYVLTDSLLSIAGEQLFEPLWSDVILDETFRSLKKIYPHREHYSFEARLASMDRAFPHARVAGWQSLERGIALYWPDPKDAHVVATAIAGRIPTGPARFEHRACGVSLNQAGCKDESPVTNHLESSRFAQPPSA